MVRLLGYVGRRRKKELTEFDWARLAGCLGGICCSVILLNPNAWGDFFDERVFRYLRLLTISLGCTVMFLLADHFLIAWSLISSQSLTPDMQQVAIHAKRLTRAVIWWLILLNTLYNPVVLSLYEGPSGTVPSRVMFPAQVFSMITFLFKGTHAVYRCWGIIRYLGESQTKSQVRSDTGRKDAKQLPERARAPSSSLSSHVGTVVKSSRASFRVRVIHSPARLVRLRKVKRKTWIALISFAILLLFICYRCVFLTTLAVEDPAFWLPAPCGARSIVVPLFYPLLMLTAFAFIIVGSPSRRHGRATGPISSSRNSRTSRGGRSVKVTPATSWHVQRSGEMIPKGSDNRSGIAEKPNKVAASTRTASMVPDATTEVKPMKHLLKAWIPSSEE